MFANETTLPKPMTLRDLFLPLLVAGTLLATGCKKDPCKDVSCLNGAACADGKCLCTTGYEGDNCGTETRAKFLSTYNVTESCPSGNFNYQITITTSSAGVDRVIINNFGGYGVSVSGTISGSSINIPTQQVDVQGTAATFSGGGQLNGNIMTITYTISSGSISETCTKTCTKL
jgi:hypothetical protein